MTASPEPDRQQSVTASVTCTPCADAIEFYKHAFGAEEIGQRMTMPDGAVAHAEIRIGNSVVMLGDEWPDGPTRSPTNLGGSTAALFIYTDDVDALWERAIEAGAEEVFPLELQFYGDKAGRVRDPFGHTWGLGQHVEDVSEEEMRRRMAAYADDTG
jgi:PhnB protein